MRRSLLSIAGLSLLLFALDQLYRVLHPEVNLVRASLVGLTALAGLAPLAWLRRTEWRPPEAIASGRSVPAADAEYDARSPPAVRHPSPVLC